MGKGARKKREAERRAAVIAQGRWRGPLPSGPLEAPPSAQGGKSSGAKRRRGRRVRKCQPAQSEPGATQAAGVQQSGRGREALRSGRSALRERAGQSRPGQKRRSNRRDWECQCGATCFHWRTECFKCQAQRPVPAEHLGLEGAASRKQDLDSAANPLNESPEPDHGLWGKLRGRLKWPAQPEREAPRPSRRGVVRQETTSKAGLAKPRRRPHPPPGPAPSKLARCETGRPVPPPAPPPRELPGQLAEPGPELVNAERRHERPKPAWLKELEKEEQERHTLGLEDRDVGAPAAVEPPPAREQQAATPAAAEPSQAATPAAAEPPQATAGQTVLVPLHQLPLLAGPLAVEVVEVTGTMARVRLSQVQ